MGPKHYELRDSGAICSVCGERNPLAFLKRLSIREVNATCEIVVCFIRDADRSSVLEARRIFEELLTSQLLRIFHIFYNLGNVLSALGDYDAAIKRYLTATALDERQPTIWKNLASAYHHAGNHDEEMKCFDKALELGV